MLCPPPFTHDSAPDPDLMAWRGGVRRPPTWQRYAMPDALDAAGLHHLVRMAQLPREELLYMAGTPFALSPSLLWAGTCEAADLLGRIAWDTHYGELGRAFDERRGYDRRTARTLGAAVVDHWFPR